MGLIQLKRTKRSGDALTTVKNDTILAFGEPFYDATNKLLYIGDGVNRISDLPYIGTNVMNALRTLLYNNTNDTAKKAHSSDEATTSLNVSSTIQNIPLTEIFEDDKKTVKKAKNADTASNVTSSINGQAITSIFESDKVTAKKATNVTGQINGIALNQIFETDKKTVKKATAANSAQEANTSKNVSDTIKNISIDLIFEDDYNGSLRAKQALNATKADHAVVAESAYSADSAEYAGKLTVSTITSNLQTYAQNNIPAGHNTIAFVNNKNDNVVGLPTTLPSETDGVVYITKSDVSIQILLLAGNKLFLFRLFCNTII